MNQSNPFGGPLLPAFGGGIAETTIQPQVLALLLLSALLIFALPRRQVIVPTLLSLFLIPVGNQIYLGGVHWLAPRIIILSALLRISVGAGRHQPLMSGGLNRIDRAFFGFATCQALAVVILNGFQTDAIINQFGFVIDFFLAYIVIRALIQDETDIYRSVKWLMFIAVILAAEMLVEQRTGRNVFGELLGGTRMMPEIRDGKIRSHGSFQHALTVGTFGATLVPLFFMLWNRARVRSVIGIAAATVIAICANASTPLLAYAAAFLAVGLWPVRKRMRTVRWGIAATVVALHLVMKAPVWFLIARIDLTGGSSSYHRALIVDQFIKHFADWWLVGTRDAATWGYSLWDTQNQYVSAGQGGGLLGFVLFIAMISHACALIGRARKVKEGDRRELECWFLGAAVFSNLVAFFGVNYFDQAKIAWFVLLAIIAAATRSILDSPQSGVRAASTPVAVQTQPRLIAMATAASRSTTLAR